MQPPPLPTNLEKEEPAWLNRNVMERSEDGSRDEAIRQTDRDAAVARLSATRKGYVEDEFIRHFVHRAGQQATRSPVINVGTYMRGAAIDELVEQWLKLSAAVGRSCQIVSLGAGSDTRFWRIATGENGEWVEKYVEMDFGDVTSRKALAIKRSRELSAVLKNNIVIGKGGTTLRGGRYLLMEGDLREEPERTVGKLVVGGELRVGAPTLVLCECVLAYMDAGVSDTMLGWIGRTFGGAGPVGGIVYEMFGLVDRFGDMMVRNLAARGITVPGTRRYTTKKELPGRFLGVGYGQAGARTLAEMWEAMEKGERKRITGLEGLDEVEELGLLLGHYAVTWGIRTDDRRWSGWGLGKDQHE